MGYKLNFSDVNTLIDEFKNFYKVYAPVRCLTKEWGINREIIRYEEINKFEDIVISEKATYPIKDIIFPITNTMTYLDEDKFMHTNLIDEREILIFARACDINAQQKQDNFYLNSEDTFYKNARDKIKFICIECDDGFDNCFCTTVNSNVVEDYNLGIKFCTDYVLFSVNDVNFEKYFEKYTKCNFELNFIKDNKLKVYDSIITDKERINKVKYSTLWKSFNDICIDCGKCNDICSTSTALTTIEINDGREPNKINKINVFSSREGFDSMIGGYNFRKTPSEKIKSRLLYKLYDYKEIFGEVMCVGCGRCIDQCPEGISLIETINKLSKIIDEK